MITLRTYQTDLIDDVHTAWNDGARNVMAVSPCGSGKSAMMARIMGESGVPSLAIAHRQELVSQIGLALARDGVRHRFIVPDATRRNCVRIQEMELGYNTHDVHAQCAVAGVDTLVRRGSSDPFLRTVRLWSGDEGHHYLRSNKWGTVISMMPDARGMLWTATPTRADGRGLGSHADGVADVLVLGPSMRSLINAGFLTDYRVFAPPSDVDLKAVTISPATGDFNQDQVRKAVHKSHIVGDVVAHYLRIANGKRGLTFTVDVEAAHEMAAAFNAAGVPAAAVSANTLELAVLIRRFRAGELFQLVNVDLFGEGFDVPACEVVSMARPTMSFVWFCQAFCRGLRLFDDKRIGIIIDHVGNTMRHGLPDAPREWTLDRRERRSRQTPNDVIPVRTCPDCTAVYERIYAACPFCGFKPEPAGRSAPDQVDGDLMELDPVVLAALRGEIARVDGECHPPRDVARHVDHAIRTRHGERQNMQQHLRSAIALWAGFWRDTTNAPDTESYRRFYLTFGVDVASAQTLGSRDAEELMMKILRKLK